MVEALFWGANAIGKDTGTGAELVAVLELKDVGGAELQLVPGVVPEATAAFRFHRQDKVGTVSETNEPVVGAQQRLADGEICFGVGSDFDAQNVVPGLVDPEARIELGVGATIVGLHAPAVVVFADDMNIEDERVMGVDPVFVHEGVRRVVFGPEGEDEVRAELPLGVLAEQLVETGGWRLSVDLDVGIALATVLVDNVGGDDVSQPLAEGAHIGSAEVAGGFLVADDIGKGTAQREHETAHVGESVGVLGSLDGGVAGGGGIG